MMLGVAAGISAFAVIGVSIGLFYLLIEKTYDSSLLEQTEHLATSINRLFSRCG